MGKRIFYNLKTEWDSGFPVLWAFRLNHLHHFKPNSSWKFSNFFTCILGSQFLLPQKARGPIMGKRILTTPKLNETLGFNRFGHSYWTISTTLSPFHSENFPNFSSSYWGANSYCLRGPIMGKGILTTPKLNEIVSSQCFGHSYWTICTTSSTFHSENFPTFSHSYWGANSYCPRAQCFEAV